MSILKDNVITVPVPLNTVYVVYLSLHLFINILYKKFAKGLG
jgi:hypothetical protein